MSTVERHIPGTLSWVDLMTPDLEGAQKFYGSLFGWTFEVGAPETGYYTECKLGDRRVAGIGKRPEDAPFPTVWSVYFDGEDAEGNGAPLQWDRIGRKALAKSRRVPAMGFM